ncbi:MAG: DNA polymerase I, partial [Bacteroidales bacterium]|nr:DNA polymerase I [Bacteroidales bacterium]
NESKLVGMSFCWKKNTAYYIPFTSLDETALFLEKIQPLFNNEHTLLIGQNLKFDLLMLQNYGMSVRAKLFDTMVAHYVLQPELRHGMDYLAEIYLKYRTIHYEDVVGVKGKNQQNIQDIDPAIVCNYAAEDADITFQLKEILEKELHANRLEKLFFDIEMPLVKTLCTIERAGVRIDTQALSQSSLVLTEQMQEIEHNVQQHVGFEFNLSSAKQVGEVLFDRFKITDKAKKTKTGQYATSEDILEELRGKHPIVPLILEYRGLKKLLSTYIDALPLLVNKHSGKIHTSYNQTITATGRLSSSNPNLQNIPIRDAQGKEIRKAFIPDEGCLFLSADYSQIELRIMAHLSQDENMVDAFLSGHDIHAATAAKIYKIPIEEVSSDMRRKAKTANFGIIYGISVFGLSDRLSISRSEAKELIDGYFDTYPGVKSYMEASIAKAKEQGYVETLLGRKRFLPDINSSNSFVRGFAERNAINAPIQGSAADIIKIAMIRITQRFEQENIQSQMTMQVHDELNFSVLKSELEIVKRIVIEEMEHAISLRVPLVADCGVGDNWLEAH